MTTLLESVSQQMTPEVLGKIGKAIGVDDATVQKGLDVVGPVIQDGLAKKTQTTTGLDEIMSMLGGLESSGGGGLEAILSMLTKGSPAAGAASAGALGGIFGPAVSAIGKTLSAKLGFDVTPLLSAAVPVVLGAIAGAAKSQNLDSKGIANMLQTEQRNFMSNASPEVLGVLKEVETVTDKANAIQQAFTADEWTAIRLAPLATTFYVMSASPSGLVGSVKELTAAGDVMRDVLKDADATSLVNIAFGSAMQKVDGKPELDENAPRESMIGMIRTAAVAVKAKMPGEAQSFASALNTLAQKVAEAAKEGGFLGIGAKTISNEEQQALNEIRAALA
ncbi:MAG: hypothetical protein KatS3mg053_2170 [Candidatus Roseilinea sp.]|nr:MAG: hypothetical protein KatS3mg053_2170 [Candidatus Roseilinea sp.]